MREECVMEGRFLREVYVKPQGNGRMAGEKTCGSPAKRLSYYMIRVRTGDGALGRRQASRPVHTAHALTEKFINKHRSESEDVCIFTGTFLQKQQKTVRQRRKSVERSQKNGAKTAK